MHRDLKPDNLLLDELIHKIYIIDFSESKEIIKKATSLTRNELILVGTPKYFSPEMKEALKKGW